MRIHTLSLGLLAGLALAGCTDVRTTSGPPVAGAAAGPGAAPLQQQARDSMGAGSPDASGGTATITGTRSAGDRGSVPTIDRGGASGTGVGANPYGSTSQPLRVPGMGQRGGGGG